MIASAARWYQSEPKWLTRADKTFFLSALIELAIVIGVLIFSTDPNDLLRGPDNYGPGPKHDFVRAIEHYTLLPLGLTVGALVLTHAVKPLGALLLVPAAGSLIFSWMIPSRVMTNYYLGFVVWSFALTSFCIFTVSAGLALSGLPKPKALTGDA